LFHQDREGRGHDHVEGFRGVPMVDRGYGSRGVRVVDPGSWIYTGIGANAMKSKRGAADT